MNSAIYQGWVRHRRFSPSKNEFLYKVFMVYLDLSELDQFFSHSIFWSKEKTNIVSFKRTDFIGDPEVSIGSAITLRIKEETGEDFDGNIRVLANLRYFGYVINPIVCYYCFDQDENLKYIVAEVKNTPWEKTHSYVLECDDSRTQKITFGKKLHVSPFNSMNMSYFWKSNTPNKRLFVNLDVKESDVVILDASMSLIKKEVTGWKLASILFLFPVMTMKIAVAIYWQALKLWLKKVPYVPYPKGK